MRVKGRGRFLRKRIFREGEQEGLFVAKKESFNFVRQAL